MSHKHKILEVPSADIQVNSPTVTIACPYGDHDAAGPAATATPSVRIQRGQTIPPSIAERLAKEEPPPLVTMEQMRCQVCYKPFMVAFEAEIVVRHRVWKLDEVAPLGSGELDSRFSPPPPLPRLANAERLTSIDEGCDLGLGQQRAERQGATESGCIEGRADAVDVLEELSQLRNARRRAREEEERLSELRGGALNPSAPLGAPPAVEMGWPNGPHGKAEPVDVAEIGDPPPPFTSDGS